LPPNRPATNTHHPRTPPHRRPHPESRPYPIRPKATDSSLASIPDIYCHRKCKIYFTVDNNNASSDSPQNTRSIAPAPYKHRGTHAPGRTESVRSWQVLQVCWSVRSWEPVSSLHHHTATILNGSDSVSHEAAGVGHSSGNHCRSICFTLRVLMPGNSRENFYKVL
jgi:hypothetical protein